MTERAELLKEIDKLPSKYFDEVLDFVGFLRQEAHEWCNAYFGQANAK